MSRYTADSVDRVRDAIDILAVIGSKVELTRKGVNSYFGCCPFHDERSPSFHVRPDEKHYHCFGCSESGDAFTFLMQTEGLDFTGSLEALADRFGVKLETEAESPEAAAQRSRRERLYSLLSRATTYYERCFWESKEAAPARAYMLQRGLGEEALRRFRVGYAPNSWDRIVTASRQAGYSNDELIAAGLAQPKRSDPSAALDRFRGRIVFPTSDARGREIGFGARILVPSDREAKYVNTAEGELYHKRAVLYGINHARGPAAKAGRMILAEGYTDVIALHQAGIDNAVGIMGTSLTAEQVAELVRSVKVLELCLDADNAGKEAMVRAAKLCADSGLELRVVALPLGADPADLIRDEGAAALRDRVATSVPYVVFEVGRTLERSDLGSAEGKDRVIAELRPVLARIPASVLRDDLIRKIAATLELPEVRLVALLGEEPRPGNGQAYAPQSGSFARQRGGGGRPGTGPRPATDGSGRGGANPRGPQPARDFLEICIAAPNAGAATLRQVQIEELFMDDLLRRAARHISESLPGPVADPPGDDAELVATVAALVERAGRRPNVTPDSVEHARLWVELDRLKRERSYLQGHGGAGLHKLALKIQELQDAIRAVDARAGRNL